MIDFGRVITAMVTPFDQQGYVDYEEAVRLAIYLVENGTDTILLTGTTGESPTLTHEEEFKLYEIIVKALAGKAKIMAGTGSNSTVTAIEATKKAASVGVDATLQVVPYYNKPSQEGIYQHFKAVAESTDLPIMLYNIPGRTGINMEPETISRCAELSTIMSIKEAAGSVDQVRRIFSLVSKDFYIYSGDDALTIEFMREGAVGVVSVASHCIGNELSQLVKCCLNNNFGEADQIHQTYKQLFDILFITSNPSPVKAALRCMNFGVGKPRLPLVDVSSNEFEKIKSELIRLKLV